MMHDPHTVFAHRANILIGTMWTTGLLLPTVLALLIWGIFGRGIADTPLATLYNGVVWLTLCTFPTFGLLALIAQFSLTKTITRPPKFRARLFIFIGSFLGITTSVGFFVIHFLQHIDYYIAYFPPLIILMPLFIVVHALVGSLVGALIGWFIWRIGIRRYMAGQDMPNNQLNKEAS